MKKMIFAFIFVLGTAASGNAQTIADNALGLRLGGASALGAEVSYQRGLSENNRLELDLGWRNASDFDAFKLTGIYQWVWNIDGGFNWYAGPGAGIANINDKRSPQDRGNDGTFLFLAGDIGVEYNFDIPLLLSLDFRPEIGFNDYTVINQFSPDIALSLRYQF